MTKIAGVKVVSITFQKKKYKLYAEEKRIEITMDLTHIEAKDGGAMT